MFLAKKLYLFLLSSLVFSSVFGQEIKGRIVDSETKENLPFVSVVYNAEEKQGVTTDYDGFFVIPSIGEVGSQVQVFFIGYKTLTISKSEIPRNGDLWELELTSEIATLDEVDLLAQENKALRIVRNAIKNKAINDPKKYESYTYHSYNKNVISYLPSYQDSILAARDTSNALRASDPNSKKHIMVMESVTRKYYKYPGKHSETILGTKISGFDEPIMGSVPDGFQNFGFYDNTIPLLNNKYLNPIADGADNKYFYILKDTAIVGTDTTYMMDYQPQFGSNFDGFIGVIHINSNKWAIERITAYPNDEGKLYIGMEQWYKKTNTGHWFPSHLKFNLVIEKLPIKGVGGLMMGDSYIDSVVINEPLKDSIFSHVDVDVLENAGKKDFQYWETQRATNLTLKEVETYNYMDSIGDRYKFDALMIAGRNFYDGFISFHNIDVNYNKLLAYNDFEGLRLGLGLYTNQDVSRKFKVGGYFGYGFSDKQWKYGGSLKLFIKEEKDNNFKLEYLKDVRDPGGIRLKYWVNVGDFAQNFMGVRMDNVEELGVYMNWRLFTYLQAEVGFRNFNLKPNYDYTFNPIYTGGDPQEVYYNFSEVGVKLRWVFKERFRKNFGQRISMGSKYPVILFNYGRGIKGVGSGEFEYNKYELGIQWDHFTRSLGRTVITLEGGYVDSPLPFSMNFSGRPSYKSDLSIVVRNTFQTMRFNEFSSTQYASLFFMHNFRSILFKYGYFKPEFKIFQGIGIGSLDYPEAHSGLPFKTLEDGYLESGFVIDNIIRVNFLNIGYWGIGGGAFYRYGPNKLQLEKDNWAFKFAFMYSFN